MKKMNRLKSLIKRNHMSQQDFADWFCVQRFTAWQILNEKRPLKADEIVKICTRFDVSADWLLGLSDSEKSIINKMRAEIKSLERFEIRGEVTPLVNVDRVLEIIDKSESEDE